MNFLIQFQFLGHTFSTGWRFVEDDDEEKPELTPAIGFALASQKDDEDN